MQEMRVRSLGRGDLLEEKNGNPLQCSCLGNPMDRGVWLAIVHGFAKSQRRLKRLSMRLGTGQLQTRPVLCQSFGGRKRGPSRGCCSQKKGPQMMAVREAHDEDTTCVC